MSREMSFLAVKLGVEAGHILLSKSSSAFEQAALHIYNGLKVFNILSLRLYILDDKGEGLDEELYIEENTLIQGNDYIPIYQLSESICNLVMVTNQNNDSYTTTIPLSHQDNLIGTLEIETKQRLDGDVLHSFSCLGEAFSAGVYYQQEARASEKNEYLFDAIMQISYNLHAVNSIDELLKMFAELTLQYLSFDRVTVFVYEYHGKEPIYNICVTSRGESITLSKIPELPVLDSEPLPLSDLSGYWIPLRLKEKTIGCILVDNIYTLCDISVDSITVLRDLCSLMALMIDNVRMFEQINKYAQFDDLTNTYNRRMGIELIEKLIKTADINDKAFTLCFIDLNYLKSVNDTLGHLVGDKMLVHFTDIVKSTIRRADIMARLGGDEFMILFPNCQLESAEMVWKRVKSKIDQVNSSKAYPYFLSASHGMAEYTPGSEMTPAQLLSIADHRMYEEKKLIKNL